MVNKRNVFVFLALFMLLGCQFNENKYTMENIDNIEPIGLKVNDDYEVANLDIEYNFYKEATQLFRDSSGCSLLITVQGYTDNHSQSNFEGKYLINNYGSTSPYEIDNSTQSYIEMNDHKNNISQKFYLRDNNFYVHVNDYKYKMLNQEFLLYSNYNFLNIKKEYINEVLTTQEGDFKFVKMVLTIPSNKTEKESFFGRNSVGYQYSLVNHPIILFKYDENDRIIECLITYEFEYENSISIAKVDIKFKNYDHQDITFPDDMESWPLYVEGKE